MVIHWFDAGPAEAALAGGKGASLVEMQAAGLPVPPGFIVTVAGYRHFAEQAGLDGLIAALDAGADLRQPQAAAAAAQPLLDRLATAAIPPELAQPVAAAYETLRGRCGDDLLVAVRSSAVSEDSAGASFAGLYESYLDLADVEQVSAGLLDCYRALWAPRALQYRAVKGMNHAAERMAVVVMQMVPAELAGVAFSVNPITQRDDEVLINASWGLGEAVVSGRVTPDNVRAAKTDGSILSYDVGEKQIEIILDASQGRGTVERPVPPDRAARPCLDDADVAAVVDLTCRAESHYGRPQDIEFAKAGGRWFLLQARPVTGFA